MDNEKLICTISGQLNICVNKLLFTEKISLSMKHLSNSTNFMNSPNFKTKIGKTEMFA